MTTTQRIRRKPRRIRNPAPAEGEQAIRWSKVIAAQARIASGHYDRDEVLRELRRN